jgi:predicted transcriptional regulator
MRGKRTDPTAAVLAKVMREMGFPPAWIAELSQIPRKTVDDIIKGNGPWSQMPRNELYDRTREHLSVLIEQVAYSSANKVMERLQAKIDKASYMEIVSILGTVTNILR